MAKLKIRDKDGNFIEALDNRDLKLPVGDLETIQGIFPYRSEEDLSTQFTITDNVFENKSTGSGDGYLIATEDVYNIKIVVENGDRKMDGMSIAYNGVSFDTSMYIDGEYIVPQLLKGESLYLAMFDEYTPLIKATFVSYDIKKEERVELVDYIEYKTKPIIYQFHIMNINNGTTYSAFTSYNFEEGMTWAVWCNSEYNTEKVIYTVGNSLRGDSDYRKIYQGNGTIDRIVQPTEVIAPGMWYYTKTEYQE